MKGPGKKATVAFTPGAADDMGQSTGSQAVTFDLKLYENLGKVWVSGSINGGPVPYNTWVALYSSPPTNPNDGYLWWPGTYVDASPFDYESDQVQGSGFYGAIIYNDIVVLTVGPTTG